LSWTTASVHGYATTALTNYLSADGVVFAVDNSPHMAERIASHPQVRTMVSSLDQLQIEPDSVDLIVSLATFHHVSHKTLVTREVRQCLRPGGFFVIVDVHEGTQTQQFFDNVVRAYCQTGHDFDFLDVPWVRLIADSTEMNVVSSSVQRTDWRFSDEATMLACVRDQMSLTLEVTALKPLVRKWLRPDAGTAALSFCRGPWAIMCSASPVRFGLELTHLEWWRRGARFMRSRADGRRPPDALNKRVLVRKRTAPTAAD
jgi:SAM-dependent methyltransferase